MPSDNPLPLHSRARQCDVCLPAIQMQKLAMRVGMLSPERALLCDRHRWPVMPPLITYNHQTSSIRSVIQHVEGLISPLFCPGKIGSIARCIMKIGILCATERENRECSRIRCTGLSSYLTATVGRKVILRIVRFLDGDDKVL